MKARRSRIAPRVQSYPSWHGASGPCAVVLRGDRRYAAEQHERSVYSWPKNAALLFVGRVRPTPTEYHRPRAGGTVPREDGDMRAGHFSLSLYSGRGQG
jgi:hypothetical protein